MERVLHCQGTGIRLPGRPDLECHALRPAGHWFEDHVLRPAIGGDRWEIFSLNALFSLGLLSVFWVLAALAAFMQMGWGEHFGDLWFTVTMIGVVFAFGLSFLGVWEIPIPGFVRHRECRRRPNEKGPWVLSAKEFCRRFWPLRVQAHCWYQP